MFLLPNKVKGKTYYSVAKCERVNGKPKNTILKYLGTANEILKNFSIQWKCNGLTAKTNSNLECGATLAVYAITQKLAIANTVNRHISKRVQLIDHGSAFEILIIKNCIEPSSLNSTNLWFSNSILSEKIKVNPSKLNARNYCNWFVPFTPEIFKEIFEDIAHTALRKFKLSKKKVIIDFSSVTTYQKYKSDEQLAQKGKPKNFEKHLRQVNYALAVTIDGIPITFDVYAGNINDPTEFKKFILHVMNVVESELGCLVQYVFTFDKGMLGKDCIELIDGKKINNREIKFVSALRPSMCRELFNDLSLNFKPIYKTNNGRISEVVETTYNLYDKKYRTILTYTEEKFEEDFDDFLKHYSETFCELENIQKKKLNGPHWNDIKKVRKRIEKIISDKFINGIIIADVVEKEGKIELKFETDEVELQEKINRFGKSAIFTNDEKASKKEIVKRYFREKNTVELCNKYLKDPYFCSINPIRCSKDQNINLRIGLCCLSLMVGMLLEKRLQKLDGKITIIPAIQHLKQIRRVKIAIEPFGEEITDVTGNTSLGHEYFEFLRLKKML